MNFVLAEKKKNSRKLYVFGKLNFNASETFLKRYGYRAETDLIIIIVDNITVGLAGQQVFDGTGGPGHFDGGHADGKTGAGPGLLLLYAFEQPRNGARYDSVSLRVFGRPDHCVRFACNTKIILYYNTKRFHLLRTIRLDILDIFKS